MMRVSQGVLSLVRRELGEWARMLDYDERKEGAQAWRLWLQQQSANGGRELYRWLRSEPFPLEGVDVDGVPEGGQLALEAVERPWHDLWTTHAAF
eukprot:2466945-Amphidinium_carterae.1